MINKTLIEEAIKQSTKSDFSTYKHGCVVFDNKGNILGRGYNYKYFRARIKGRGVCSVHAEMNAINRVDHKNVDLSKASLLVIRRSMGGVKLCSSRPCVHCTSLIIDCGIRSVYYSNDKGIIERMEI